MPRWTLADAPSGVFPDRGRLAAPQGAVVLAAGLLALTVAGCSVGASGGDTAASSNSLVTGSASASATGSATSGTTSGAGATKGTSTPPPGSGATAQGIAPTTPPPIVPRGSTKTMAACRQMYPTVTGSIAAWNAANRRNDTGAMRKAAQALTRAADVIGPVAKGGGERRLVSLTGRVSGQLKRVATDYGAGKDVNGASLTKATTDLWTYCRSAP